MAMIQSSLSPIELADRWQRRLFVTSVIFGVTAALIGALLAWLLWRANNRYQEAVTTEANARIEEAKRGAEEARKDASEANKKTKELELRIEEEARKRAEAEERLENLRRRQSIRESLRGVSTNFHELLKDKPVGEAVILYVSGGSEDVALANALHRALNKAGWQVPPPKQISSTVEVMPSAWATGDIVIVCPEKNAPPHANALLSALVKDPYPFKLALIASSGNNLPDARPRIVINPRQ
jgi:hypothetical protein